MQFRPLAQQGRHAHGAAEMPLSRLYGCAALPLAGAVLGASRVRHISVAFVRTQARRLGIPMGLPPFALDNPSALYAPPPAPADHGRACTFCRGAGATPPGGMISAQHYSERQAHAKKTVRIGPREA